MASLKTRQSSRRTRQLLADTAGLSTVEYIIILCLIAVACFAIWGTFGQTVNERISQANTTMESLNGSAGGGP